MIQLLAHVTLADAGAIAAAFAAGVVVGGLLVARLLRRHDARRAPVGLRDRPGGWPRA